MSRSFRGRYLGEDSEPAGMAVLYKALNKTMAASGASSAAPPATLAAGESATSGIVELIAATAAGSLSSRPFHRHRHPSSRWKPSN